MNALEWSRHLIGLYFRHSMTANSIVGGQVWLKSKLIEALIVVLDTLKNDEDPSKNESTSLLTQHYFYHKSMDIISDVQGQLTS